MIAKRIFGLPILLFLACVGVILLSHYYNQLPTGIPGALALCFVIGGIFGWIGDRLPIWDKYIGGGTVLVFIGSAALVYMGWLTDRETAQITHFIQQYQYLDFFISVLIVGNILAVKKAMLIRSLIGYVPVILLAIGGAMLFGLAVGLLIGLPLNEIICIYVLPVMCGGNGAGVIPLSEIYESITGLPRDSYYSKAFSILTIANIISILAASTLNWLGKKYPSITGEGRLVRQEQGLQEEDSSTTKSVSKSDLAGGLLLAMILYVLAELMAKVILPGWGNVQIHRYAWLVVLVALVNISGLIPESLKQGAKSVSDFLGGELLWILMVGIGVVYTDLETLFAAVTPTSVFLSAMIVLGAIIGAGFGGRLFGFYEVESAISAGLCMANRGGTGDLEVLAASNRMQLLSYAQISSRLGGGIVLILGAVMFGIFA
ncbi:2-hydroxycarboxylate transporter family protein [Parendozoicomonas haliclonae]|uniref:Citrate-sodium symporter n=1 Tax=Parendozoicomonas haliclonae TaxID=1960125 RepID=A0A1X7AJF9_9GAMM|nr:Citrate-sodium symporter [Parendozoicomonas haliclonae]